MYKALYRTWRPQNFSSIVGQQSIVRTLSNSVIENKISHAYLFVGPRGTGKTSIAKIFAKAINCSDQINGEPCCVCNNCLTITEGSCMDVYEMDAASNRGIDEIREVIDSVKFNPVQTRFKIYIIDEVHMLTNEAFNALLKTLEEPPEHVIFILCTTDVQKVPATILSRCQRYDFRKLAVTELEAHLKKICLATKINITDAALRLICEHAAGGARDALSVLDQCSIMCDGVLTEEIVREMLGITASEQLNILYDAFFAVDCQAIYSVMDESDKNRDVRQLFSDFLKYSYNRMREATLKKDFEIARKLSTLIIELSSVLNDVRWSMNPKLMLQAALIRIMLKLSEQSHGNENEINQSPAQVSPVDEPENFSEQPVINVSPEEQDTAATGNMTDIWNAVLEELKSMNKRLVVECAKNGNLLSTNNIRTIVAFEHSEKFFKERLEKPDYKKQVEIALCSVLKKDTRLEVIIKTDTALPTQKKSKLEEIKNFFELDVNKI